MDESSVEMDESSVEVDEGSVSINPPLKKNSAPHRTLSLITHH